MPEYAIWQTWGPMFTAHRYRGQPLGISYTDGVDTRFNDIMVPGPKFTAIDRSGVGGTTANVNGAAFKNVGGITYLYISRGTDPARVKVSDFSVSDPGISLTERVTDVLYTKNGSGTEEITFFMAGDEYRVITTFVAPTNLVTNDGFETNTTDWSTEETIARSSEQAKYGTYSLKATRSGVGAASAWAYTAVTLTAVAHTATVWVYIPTAYDGGGFDLNFEAFTSSTTVSGSANMSLRDQWQPIQATITPDAGDLSGFLAIRSTGSDATAGKVIYIDGVQVTKNETVTAHASQTIRISGLAGSLVAGFSEESAYSIDLSGSVEMETGTWTTRAVINGDDCTPTGFATDGITWVWAMCRGPAILNPVRNTFELVFDRVSNSTRNGAQTKSLATIGTLIPMDRVLMHLQDGHLSVHAGPEAFPENDGTILGTVTAFDFDGDWGLMALYNEEADKTYLLAFRPRQPEDNHGELLSYYCLGTQTEECEHILYMAKKGGRTNPTWLLGKDSNAQYLTAGRDQQWYTDANYEFATNVTQSAYMTELRAMPGEDILPKAFFFETSGTTEAQYVDLYIKVNGGSEQYVGRADRAGRLRFELGGALADTRCWRIQPILKLYNDSTVSGYPAVIGPLHMEYDVVPADMAQVTR